MTGNSPSEKVLPDLVVTENGVPVPDQADGIRRFKEACLKQREQPDYKLRRFEAAHAAMCAAERKLSEAEYDLLVKRRAYDKAWRALHGLGK